MVDNLINGIINWEENIRDLLACGDLRRIFHNIEIYRHQSYCDDEIYTMFPKDVSESSEEAESDSEYHRKECASNIIEMLPHIGEDWQEFTSVQLDDGTLYRSVDKTEIGAEMGYWTNGEDYWFIMATPDGYPKGRFCVISCICGHPYIACNDFSYGNSDGSTDHEDLLVSVKLEPSALKDKMRKYAYRYIARPSH